jgi:hypothetical protein
MGSPLLFTEEFEVVIMIELVTEEMHGSDRNADLKLITSEPTVGKAKLSPRAKWRSVLSACRSALKKTLTAPALSETPVYVRHPATLGMMFTEKAAQPSGGFRLLLPTAPIAVGPFPFIR